MIIPTRWRDVPGEVRVRLSTGRIAYVMPRVPGLPHMVVLRIGRDTPGGTRAVVVDPDAYADVLFDEFDLAQASLKVRFGAVEFVREDR